MSATLTPPRPLAASPTVNPSSIPVAPKTPKPQQARLENLTQQIDQLITQRTNTERKHRSELGRVRSELTGALGQVEDLRAQLGKDRENDKELERCKEEGENMRKELLEDQDLLYKQAQAVLANEQQQAEEILEVQRMADLARLTRDHKLSLFQAREAALVRENDNLQYLNEELVAENEDFASAHAELNSQLDDIYAERDQLQSDIVVLQRNLNKAGKSRSGEMEKWEKEREEAESTIHSLQAAQTKLSASTAAQATQLATLKTQLSSLTAKEKKARDEQEAWVKEERVWEDKERDWEARFEALEKENRKVRERVSKEKDSKTGAEARLREDLEEREDELLKQVEETKRVEQLLRAKEKEIYALKKSYAASARPTSASVAPSSPAAAAPKKTIKPSAPVTKPKKSAKAVLVEEDDEAEDFAAAMDEIDAGGADEDEDVEVVIDLPKPKKEKKEKTKRPLPDSDNEPEPEPAAPKEKKARPKPKANVSSKLVAVPAEADDEDEPPAKISKPKKLKSAIVPPTLAADPFPSKPAAKRKPAEKIVPISTDEPEGEDNGSPVKEKKKKRKLGAGGGKKPDFSWSGGDGDSGAGGGFQIELSPIKGKQAPLPSRLR